ncbi:MAG: glycosyltransferase, partial [Candidatus Kapabacteria bacterium]|nr:glycosyltransferase [Candidatus Kapabacteria bacterium]MDW7996901.1 glycosyltransferase [Bacteroidota bacterium]
MRVAVVCGHFMPEVGYQEVWIARALAQRGVQVRVVTTTAVSSSARKVRKRAYPAGLQQMPEGYEVLRLPVDFRFRSAVVARGVVPAVVEWQPDAILLLGIGKLFGVPVLEAEALLDTPISCFFSELAEYRRRHSLPARVVAWMQDRGFELVKRVWYRKAIRRAQLLVCNTPGTLEWLRACCKTQEEKAALAQKARVQVLGYDHSLFFFDPVERELMRRQLGCQKGEIVALTITRVLPHKGLERIIDAIGTLQRQGMSLRYVLIGGLRDKYQRQLEQRMRGQMYLQNFQLLPFQPPDQTRRF